jgi:hypothetical protein
MGKSYIRGFLCLVSLFLGVNAKLQAQTWSFTGSMGAQRAFHTATVLNNGQVLVTGGRNRLQYGLNTALLYNPATETFSPTGNLNTGRHNSTATLLNNGKVLIAGGDSYIGAQHFCYSSAELYDPSSGEFTFTGSMHAARCGYSAPGFTATLLNDGQVLIAGGGSEPAELYDPSSGTFTLTGSLNTPRFSHTATLLPNGEVLIAGGTDTTGSTYLISAELYNPSTGSFSNTGSMHTARAFFTATLLGTGEVLAAAGLGGNSGPILSSAEL